MKPTTIGWLAGIALAATAQAGSPPAETTTQSAAWQPFVGASGGYLTDLEQAMVHLQAGLQIQGADGASRHALYLEVGWTADDADFSNLPPPGIVGARSERAEIDMNLIPVTLNYQYTLALTERLNVCLGAGAGIAIVDSSQDWSWTQAVPPPNNTGGGSDDDTDVAFYGQIAASLEYEVSSSLVVFAGVRYILMDDEHIPVNVATAPDYQAGIDGDLLIELGARFSF